MRHLLLLIAALTGLAGCLEYTPMYKVGVTPHESNVAQAQCNTFAANTVPILLVRDVIPVYDSNGNVVSYIHEVYDANEGRRHSVVKQCLTDQGFERVTIPYCSDEQLAGKTYRPLTTNPPITDSICAIRQPGGNRVLIDLTKPAG